MTLSKGEEEFSLHLKAYKLANHARREFRFFPPRRWRFDFAFPDLLVAIEIEGGTWGKSRHGSGHGFENDCRKYNAAASENWQVMRYTTDMILRGEDLPLLAQLVEAVKLSEAIRANNPKETA